MDPSNSEDETSPDPEPRISGKDIGFTIIGNVKPVKIAPVDVTVPGWIQNPETFDGDTSNVSPLSEVERFVSEETLDVLKKQGISELFPVQRCLIPHLTRCLQITSIRPREVCVSAPTGSGKTLAYIIPLVEYLKTKLESKIRALVVVPVGELAIQVKKVFDVYTKGTSIKSIISTGNTSFENDSELISKLRFDILISTPGRLVDLILRTSAFDLTSLEILVLDEADPLRESNQPCMCCIDRSINSRTSLSFSCACSATSFESRFKPIQKWLFSATLSSDPVQLENMDLFHPKLFLAKNFKNSNKTNIAPSTLREQIIEVDESRKPLILWYLLEKLKYRRVLCFTASLENTHRLNLLLKRIPGITSAEFSSKSQTKQRSRLLKRFSNGEIDVLVSSDLMARGLDVNNINFVISYDTPSNYTAYVHRSGRTARAGKSGTAITFVTRRQYKAFKAIVKKAHGVKGHSIDSFIEHTKISDEELNELESKYEFALKNLEKDFRKELIDVKRKKNQVKNV